MALFKFPKRLFQGGGIAVIFRSVFSFKLLSFSCSRTAEISVLHGRIRNETFLMVVVYRPPGTLFEELFSCISDILTEHSTNFNTCVVLGDFNLHFGVSSDKHASSLNYLLGAANFYPLFEGKTHVKGNTLDQIFVTNSHKFTLSTKHEISFSDHYLLLTKFNCPFIASPSVTSYRNWKLVDLHILSNDISFSVDTTEKGHLTVDENVANFSNILEAISLDRAPVLKKMQRTTKLAFFDQELQCLKREKRKLERKLKKHRHIFLRVD